ncbi:MAG: hypothetical protein WC028_25600 [Candidatus Obscuribacterales bacterium]
MNTSTSNTTTNDTTAHACPHCPQSQILVWQDRRRCIACGAWLEDNQHLATYFVVTRALDILLSHGFVGGLNADSGRIIKEEVLAKQRLVEQQRLEFQQLESTEKTTAVRSSVRWFTLKKPVDYQYLNKASGRVLKNQQVPEAVRSAARQLATANTLPGSLRVNEVNLTGDSEGRKFIRMEQSYVLDETTAHNSSLILRVEFSWL